MQPAQRVLRGRLINRQAQGFAWARLSWYFSLMHEDRIDSALGRIEAAMARIAAARESAAAQAGQPTGGSTRVVELVNAHEKLREQVAESLRELDDLIGQLEA